MKYELQPVEWKGVVGSTGTKEWELTGDQFLCLWFMFWSAVPIVIVLFAAGIL